MPTGDFPCKCDCHHTNHVYGPVVEDPEQAAKRERRYQLLQAAATLASTSAGSYLTNDGDIFVSNLVDDVEAILTEIESREK